MHLTRTPGTLENMKRLTITLILSVFGALVSPISIAANAQSTSSKAQTQWYQVDMVVFSQLDLGQQQNENWPHVAPFTLPKTPTISLVPPALYPLQSASADIALTENTPPVATTSYPLVPSTAFKLQSEAAYLTRAQHYKIIGELAWLQPIGNNATPVHIQAANDQTAMDGLITFTKKHFILMYLNSIFSTALSALSNPSSNLKALASQDGQVRFQLIQSLRMRTNELDYIDFPFYGILVEITPHAAPSSLAKNASVNPA